MKKIIGLFIFSLLLFANANDAHDKYMFPDAFMKDNDLVYDKIDVVIAKTKKKKEKKKKDPLNMGIGNIQYIAIAPMNAYLNQKQKIKPMTLIYVAPTFIKRKDIKLVGIGLGFLINDWLNTELLVETSLANSKLQIYDITNEYTINFLGTKHFRANLLTALATGGILDKTKKVEKFFFAYGAGAEIEFVMNKVKLVGAYKFEVFERKDTKAVKSNIYSVKIKFNFPF